MERDSSHATAPATSGATLRGAANGTVWKQAVAAAEAFLLERELLPTPVQRAAFLELPSPGDVLFVAPTGSGKTLAAVLPILARLQFERRERGADSVGTRVVYLAPTRALVSQQGERIAQAARSIASELRIAIRTGDSDAAARTAFRTAPPDVLVVTPESLAVILGTSARTALSGVTDVVLDEAHQLAESKRGALLAATLATLDYWVGSCGKHRPRRIGLSATAHPVEALARWLGGTAPARTCVLPPTLAPEVRILDPGLDGPYPAAGWAGRSVLPAVARAIAETSGKTLVFVHSRPLAEQWTQALREVLPSRIAVACFHGSMSAGERAGVVRGLTNDELRAVVTTSSLEVGVDVPEAEQVVMVGAPGSVTRLVQSAGRSAHRPGGRSKVAIAPLHAWDRIAATALERCVETRTLEAVRIREGDLDVAMQAVLGLCGLEVPMDATVIARVLRTSAPFATLSDEDVSSIVTQLSTGGAIGAGDPSARRIAKRRGGYVLAGRASRSRYLRNVGTICAEPAVFVRAQGRPVGQIDGAFAARLDVGEVFSLGGASWRVVARVPDGLQVVRDRSPARRVARWAGQFATQSAVVLAAMEHVLGEIEALIETGMPPDRLHAAIASRLGTSAPSTGAIIALLTTHRRRSTLPTPERFVIDRVRDRGNVHLVAYTFAGGAANEVIGRAAVARFHRATGAVAEMGAHDLGVVLTVDRDVGSGGFEVSMLRSLFDPDGLETELAATLVGSQLARSHFREVARVAQLTDVTAAPGAASPELIYDVLCKHAPNSVLLRALDRSLWNALDGAHARAVLTALRTRPLHVNDSNGPSALAIPMFLLASRDRMATGDLESALTVAAHALFERLGGGELP